MSNKPTAYLSREEDYIFVSYAHADSELVYAILHEFEKNKYRFWYDTGIRTSSGWADTIAESINGCRQFVVFLSAQSVISENVKDEIALAKDLNKQIFAIRLDNTELPLGLKLQLGRIQFTDYNASDFANFYVRIFNELGAGCRYPMEVHVDAIKGDFASRYTERYEISSGPSGVIYRAYDTHTKQLVLLKMVSFENTFVGKYAWEAIYNEANILARADCPFVPVLMDCYENEETYVLVERFIYGKTLTEVYEKYLLPDTAVVDYTIKIANILKALHKRRIAHFDVKPANVVVSDEGDVYLIDFGAAKILEDGKVKVCLGTPGFAAPEQFGKMADHRADIYGLGQLLKSYLWILNTKNAEEIPENLPVSMEELIEQEGEFGKLYSRFCTDSRLARIVDKMTALDADERYSDISTAIYDLQSYKDRKLDSFFRPQIQGKANIAMVPIVSPIATNVTVPLAAQKIADWNESTTALWADTDEE